MNTYMHAKFAYKMRDIPKKLISLFSSKVEAEVKEICNNDKKNIIFNGFDFLCERSRFQ